MRAKIMAIGLDSAEWSLVETWMKQGRLPNFLSVFEHGFSSSLENMHVYTDETPWVNFMTGCWPTRTGYWSPQRLVRKSYRLKDVGPYSFQAYRPFFALGKDFKVNVFDMPHCGNLFRDVHGLQVLGWGSHSQVGPGRSDPPRLLASLKKKYGLHPAYSIQHKGVWWDSGYLTKLKNALVRGISLRPKICRHLFSLNPPDLFLTAFGEPHVGGHLFWHLSDATHPLSRATELSESDFLLEVYQAIDRALGEIMNFIPEDYNILVFSTHGGCPNTGDLNSMVFLPEWLYRFNFPGRHLLSPARKAEGRRTRHLETWSREIWRTHYNCLPPHWFPPPFNGLFRRLASVGVLNRYFFFPHRVRAAGWQPVVWYQGYWPRMRAFVLPSYGNGYIRINLIGREPHGLVDPSEYDSFCRRLEDGLRTLVDAGTKRPVVREVIRTRKNGEDADPLLSDADLVVVWEPTPTDSVESPLSGTLGPVAYRVSGGHTPLGFLLARGPQIPRKKGRAKGKVVDLAPTILELLGARLPGYLDGRSLL